jgi:hypothetical protein
LKEYRKNLKNSRLKQKEIIATLIFVNKLHIYLKHFTPLLLTISTLTQNIFNQHNHTTQLLLRWFWETKKCPEIKKFTYAKEQPVEP